MVRFWMSSSSSSSGFCAGAACGMHVGAAASVDCPSKGVCVPVPGLETGLDGTVWLSRVRRRDVIITCGTRYVLCSTWMAAARDLRSVMGVSESSLHLLLTTPTSSSTAQAHVLCLELVG